MSCLIGLFVGIYIALLLRFDYWLAEVAAHRAAYATAVKETTSNDPIITSTTSSTNDSTAPATATATASAPLVITVANPSTPYFTSAMIFYFFGLLTTLLVMYYFKAAQVSYQLSLPRASRANRLTYYVSGVGLQCHQACVIIFGARVFNERLWYCCS
jgi:hypothetical protein